MSGHSKWHNIQKTKGAADIRAWDVPMDAVVTELRIY